MNPLITCLTKKKRFFILLLSCLLHIFQEYDHIEGGDNGKDPSGVTTPHGYMPIWGNFRRDSGGECAVPVAQRFQMPQSYPNNNNRTIRTNGVFWYSYNFANVHTTVLSSEHDMSKGSPQHLWLEMDLASVNRSVTPWLIVELHRPLYNGEVDVRNNNVGIGMRMGIEHLLRDYNVDVVLAGHYHSYHRTCDGLFRGRCHNGGPIHLTIGTAGAKLRTKNIIYPNRWSQKSIMGEYGYGRVTVSNASMLHFEFVKAGPKDDNHTGQVLDDVWIARDRS